MPPGCLRLTRSIPVLVSKGMVSEGWYQRRPGTTWLREVYLTAPGATAAHTGMSLKPRLKHFQTEHDDILQGLVSMRLDPEH